MALSFCVDIYVYRFARGLNQDFRSFKSISKHLTGFWRYALSNFRLDASPTYIDCFWQLMRDDIIFNQDANALKYTRVYKVTDFDAPPSDRVLKILFGLLCSTYRRLKYTLDYAFDCLGKSGIIQPLIELYKRCNDWNLDYTASDALEDIRSDLELKLFPRRAIPVCP